MDKREAIDKVIRYVSLLKEHFHFEKAFLYGSYANNTNREDSDIDVAILVNEIEGDYFTITPLLWKIRRQVDDRIEPFLIEKENDDAGFIEEIEKHGIEII